VSVLPVALALAAAAAPSPLLELPGTAALPPVPPLAPPQPPLTEVRRIPGTVTARARVNVGIDAGGIPTKVSVVQRLDVRALGDYAFFIPAPAVSVVAAAGSESRPGLRPNQIVWQGFSPRRRRLSAAADLRVADVRDALPLRIRISGAPTRPGPFELVLSLENATSAVADTFTAVAAESDIAKVLGDLRAAARIGSAVEERTVRVQGNPAPATFAVSAPLAIRGSVRFPAGTVRDLTPARFSGRLGSGREAMLISIRGVARRPAAPMVRVVAEPTVDATLPPPTAQTLETAIIAYLRYARTRQYERFLANPDPRGPSRTTYVFETAAPEPRAAPGEDPSEDRGLPAAVIVAGLALLGTGIVVLWAHL
jgi:hypothetical protein